MRRHLLLKRQQRYHTFGQHLLKKQPLTERIIRQQHLLPAMLGLQTIPDTSESNTLVVQPWHSSTIDLAGSTTQALKSEAFAEDEQETLQIGEALQPGENPLKSWSEELSTQTELPAQTKQAVSPNPQTTAAIKAPTPSFPSALTSQTPGAKSAGSLQAADTTHLLNETPGKDIASSLHTASNMADIIRLPEEDSGANVNSSLNTASNATDTTHLLNEAPGTNLTSSPNTASNATDTTHLLNEAPGTNLTSSPNTASNATDTTHLLNEAPGTNLTHSSEKTSQQNTRRTINQLANRLLRPRIQEIAPGRNASAANASEGETEQTRTNPQNAQETQSTALSQNALPAISTGSDLGKNTEELFAPNENDRSPQAWLARLTRGAGNEQKETRPQQSVQKPQERPSTPGSQAKMPPSTQRQAEPFAQHARTFLKPLLGIDPGEVPIYHDEQAEQTNAMLNADAFSTGETIETARGQIAQTPESLGLLAHELTHVARQQRPYFIPPVVRLQTTPNSQEAVPDTFEEEDLALRVEQQVRQIARATPIMNTPELPDTTEQANTLATQANKARGERGIWGNLPAPWEPLPDWLVDSSSAPTLTPTIAPVSPRPAITWQSPGTEQSSQGQALAETGIRRAATGRTISESGDENDPAQNSQEHTTAQEPEQDLDALARQVYNVLKRRLSVEQRRGV